MSHGNKQQWILAKRPEGMPDSSEVILQDAPIPETGRGMLLVKNHYTVSYTHLTLPTMRTV